MPFLNFTEAVVEKGFSDIARLPDASFFRSQFFLPEGARFTPGRRAAVYSPPPLCSLGSSDWNTRKTVAPSVGQQVNCFGDAVKQCGRGTENPTKHASNLPTIPPKTRNDEPPRVPGAQAIDPTQRESN